MPVVQCPIEGCEYETPDVDPVVAAALITAHSTSHQAPWTRASSQPARVKKVKRPSISPAGTTEDWHYFMTRWADYVKATKLEGTDKVIQLLECCDEQLRKDLTRNAGGSLAGMTEDEVFEAIKTLAIREENTMVARVALHNMRPERDEPIRAFGARLRGQASICKFTQQCPDCERAVNYTEAMIKDVLCRGLEDSGIQMDLLGEKNQDMTLEQTLRFIEAKEAGKRSASRLLLPQAMDAVGGSLYKRQKKAQTRATPPAKTTPLHDRGTCTYCGLKGHGRNPPTRVRREECPAFGTKCNYYCSKDHHHEKMCRRKRDAKTVELEDTVSESPDHEDTVADSLCGVKLADHARTTALPHHVFNRFTKEWLRRRSKPQPYVRLKMSSQWEDYDHLGLRLNAPQTWSFVSAMADTGCQSCLAGLKVVKKLGLSVRDLIPVDIKMHAANNNNIRILGAAILRFSGKDKKGEEHSTRQIVYVQTTRTSYSSAGRPVWTWE